MKDGEGRDYDCSCCGEVLDLVEMDEHNRICWDCLKVQRDALLAYAKCQAAMDEIANALDIESKRRFLEACKRHGFVETNEFTFFDLIPFVRSLRDRALAKARGETP